MYLLLINPINVPLCQKRCLFPGSVAMAGADLEEREILKWLVAGGVEVFPGKHLILGAPSSGCFLLARKGKASVSSPAVTLQAVASLEGCSSFYS